MIQAAVFDGEFLDPFSPFDNGGGAAEVGVSRRDVAEAFVVIEFCLIFVPLRVSTRSQKSSLMQIPQSAP